MRIIGFIGFITCMMVGIGSNLPSMIDPPSFIIVVGGVVALLLLGGHSIPTMVRGIAPGSLSDEELRVAADGWKMPRIYCLGMCVLAPMIGWVIMLKNLNDPAAIGPGMAISLLTVLYGLILSFGISLPLQSNLLRRIPDAADGSITLSGVLGGLLAALVMLLTFGALLSVVSK